MRALILLAAMPSIAMAELAADIDEDWPEPPALSTVAVPCLREYEERRYVVTWEIRNTVTGEVRSVDRQEVRLRC
jgi:hypothetical protein